MPHPIRIDFAATDLDALASATGRIAVLASDQAWLWGRGYEGGESRIVIITLRKAG